MPGNIGRTLKVPIQDVRQGLFEEALLGLTGSANDVLDDKLHVLIVDDWTMYENVAVNYWAETVSIIEQHEKFAQLDEQIWKWNIQTLIEMNAQIVLSVKNPTKVFFWTACCRCVKCTYTVYTTLYRILQRVGQSEGKSTLMYIGPANNNTTVQLVQA